MYFRREGLGCTQLFAAPLAALADPGHLPGKATLKRKPPQILRIGAIPKSPNSNLTAQMCPTMTPHCSRIPLCDSHPSAAEIHSDLGWDGGCDPSCAPMGMFLQEEHRLGPSAQTSGTDNAQPCRIAFPEPQNHHKSLCGSSLLKGPGANNERNPRNNKRAVLEVNGCYVNVQFMSLRS